MNLKIISKIVLIELNVTKTKKSLLEKKDHECETEKIYQISEIQENIFQRAGCRIQCAQLCEFHKKIMNFNLNPLQWNKSESPWPKLQNCRCRFALFLAEISESVRQLFDVNFALGSFGNFFQHLFPVITAPTKIYLFLFYISLRYFRLKNINLWLREKWQICQIWTWFFAKKVLTFI